MIKVMIVEDEMLVRLGLKNSINWEKFQMTVVADLPNGKAALEYYRMNKPDIIITDIKMPVMDGMELITHIRRDDSATIIVVLTCLEEFALIKEAMSLGVSDYLLKLTATTEEIEKLLGKLRLLARQQVREGGVNEAAARAAAQEAFIKNYIYYGNCSAEMFARHASELGLKLRPEDLMLVLMELDNYQDFKERYEDEKGFLTNFAFMNVLREILDQDGTAVHENDARYVILINAESADSLGDKMRSLLERIVDTTQLYLNLSLSMGLSEIHSGYQHLPAMYQEAELALRYKFFLGPGVIARLTDWDPGEEMRSKLERLHELFACVNLTDDTFQEPASEKINQLIRTLSPDPAGVKDSLCVLSHWLFEQYHFTDDAEYADLVSHEQAVIRADFLDEALEEISRFITFLNQKLRSRRNMRSEIICALQFIRDNYKSDITLRDVAGHISLSLSYSSTLFKSEIGMTVTEYLNSLRIEEAKRLLRETDLKTYEVAEASGFGESTYFNSIFKKLTRITPHQYREQWGRGRGGG